MYFQSLQQVQFRDTDAAGIAHFSVFFNWMERTEHQMLRYFGTSVVQQEGGRTLSWPRVATDCHFRQPLKFEDVFGVELTVQKLGRSSATYRFQFLSPQKVTMGDEDPQKRELITLGNLSPTSWFAQESPLAEGTITAVCCHVEHGQRPQPVAIPGALREQLERLQNG